MSQFSSIIRTSERTNKLFVSPNKTKEKITKLFKDKKDPLSWKDKKTVDYIVQKKLNNIFDWLENTAEFDRAKAFSLGLSPRNIEFFMNSADAKKEIQTIIKKETYMKMPDEAFAPQSEHNKLIDTVLDKFINEFGDEFKGMNDYILQRMIRFLADNLKH